MMTSLSLPETIELLEDLVRIPSLSRKEDEAGDLFVAFFEQKGIQSERYGNNVLVRNLHYNPEKPTILLNSHIDTVSPNTSWTRDPFLPDIEDGKLFGLGSNDAGGPMVCLIAAFLHFYSSTKMSHNIVLVASAEEEISGRGGVESVLGHMGDVAFAIVGEPTQLRMGVAEKGLMVLDCIAHGKSGHAARTEGENAIYRALDDIDWFRTFQFPKISETLGPVKMSVTMINSGTQHNVVPDTCSFTVDVRSTDAYTNEQLLAMIQEHVQSQVIPRSTRLNPSGLPDGHVLEYIAEKMGIETFGSPTLSDQALMPFSSVKIGPGDSARSHTADEFIFIEEIENGISCYIDLLDNLV